jgi:hypothetical protein
MWTGAPICLHKQARWCVCVCLYNCVRYVRRKGEMDAAYPSRVQTAIFRGAPTFSEFLFSEPPSVRSTQSHSILAIQFMYLVCGCTTFSRTVLIQTSYMGLLVQSSDCCHPNPHTHDPNMTSSLELISYIPVYHQSRAANTVLSRSQVQSTKVEEHGSVTY